MRFYHRTFRDSQNSNAGLPLNEGYQYYPRYYPSWSWGGSEQTYNMAANTGIEGGRFYQVSEDGKRYEYPGMAAYDNVGAFGGRPSKGGSYKLKPPSDMSDGTTSFGSPAGRRRCCVVMSIVGLFLLVAAGVAIGIYFGVVDKPGNEQQTSTMSPVAAKSIQLTMAVEGTYSSALDDPASPEYQAKEQAVIKEVDEAMADTQMANSYIGFRVDGFSNGSIIVHGQAEFQAATYRNIDGKKGYGTSCTAKTNCATVDSICSQTAGCSCPENKFYKADTDSCVLKKGQGESCTGKGQCLGTGTVCAANLCDCPSGQFFHTDTQTCIDKYEIGVECQNTMQCLPIDSECSQNEDSTKTVCQCPASKYLVGTACLDKKGLEGSCAAVEECLYSSAECTEGKCQCGRVDQGSSCTDALQCKVGGATCLGDVCACTDTQFLDEANNRCADKITDGACDSADMCLHENAECVSFQCTCPADRYLDEDNKACALKKAYGLNCDTAEQCATENAACSGTCTCNDDSFHDTSDGADVCTQKRGDNEACDNAAQCLRGNSECDQVCGCPGNMYMDDSTSPPQCSNKLAYEAVCTSEVQCITSAALCVAMETASQCMCSANYFHDSTNDKCTFKLMNGEACTDTLQCRVQSADCDGTCQCDALRYLDVKAHSEFCESAEQCSTGACDNHQCSCLDGQYYSTAEGACKDRIGDGGICANDDECSYTNAACVETQCTCGAGYYVNHTGLACEQKKLNGEACGVMEECLVTSAQCLSSACSCSQDQYLENLECRASTK
ncbi:hypothetical protein MAR_016195 [Mya arenaria]|uniref:Prion-like-(Q/N-rich) domain-bearing protein 25 n=1 Tax=Mya arenaria TaxID=6604 RepID=A0ABY7FNB7_MYAAR|nr:hypothetical protein MAR_016195 [Mya arenaria]